ncbi:MAG TPA: hypothetical protein VNX28_13050 [Gemmataceae bacterium]|jgi:hypothetical protein|nr:hypothetical protein [Gemmataceae bacterium]
MKPLYSVLALAGGLLLLVNHAAGGDKGTVVTLGALKSTAPADWKSQAAANKFRAYQFAVGDAELVIFYFGEGGGGNPADNIARWKSQFLPPEGKTIEEVSKLDKLKVGSADLTYLDIQGTYLSKNPPFDPNAKTERKANYRRFGIFFACEGGPYFITLTGPARTLEQNKKSFDDWLKNFK